MPESSTLGTVLSCDSVDDISQRFAFAGVESGLGAGSNATDAGDCDGEDEDGSTSEAATSSLSATPVLNTSAVAAAATSLAARRFHRRQIVIVS